ncbi:phosphoglycolate phosphatase [Palleronia sediminis]|uniref:Phosphoglycolate phosphatase n=1 Tax=Palleronia sediminis TaxID=2547833 RepID=A0A4R6AJ31_9RHOB|nr:phosphoglycolate phosphatase [Palleronia sediminis]TDL83497.1 phosphoglycolate phosphatase [Palleronia sediminis]
MARIVFDLDGTLLNSAPDICAAGNAALATLPAPRPAPLSLGEATGFIGSGADQFVARMRAARGIDAAAHPALLATFIDAYEGATGLTRAYPGAVEAIDALRAAGHRLGICTNKPVGPLAAVLDAFDLARRFEVSIGGDTLPVRKPDPAPLRAALEALGKGPCLFVGDSETDAETARAASVPFLLFTGGYRKAAPRDLPHDALFDDHAALPDLVAGMLAGIPDPATAR